MPRRGLYKLFWQLLASPRTERTGHSPRASTLLHPRTMSPQAGAPICINGGNIVTDNGNRIKIVDTDNSLALLPPDHSNTFDRLGFEFWFGQEAWPCAASSCQLGPCTR